MNEIEENYLALSLHTQVSENDVVRLMEIL